MTTNYPGGLDSFSEPSGTDPRDTPSLSTIMNNIGDAIEAIEAELGILLKGSHASLKARLDLLTGKIPAGSIVLHGSETIPSGWLLCNGSAVSRTTYSDLFAVVGTTFGVGDGSTTFNLPDYRGRYAVDETGTAIGTQKGSLDHTHTVDSVTHTHGEFLHGIGQTETAQHNHSVGTANATENRGTDEEGNIVSDHAHSIDVSSHSHGVPLVDHDHTGTLVVNNPKFLTMVFLVKT